MMLELVDWRIAALGVFSLATTIGLIGLGRKFSLLSGGTARLMDVQAAHKKSTARVGGVAIFATLVVGSLLVADKISAEYLKIIAATSVLFFVGLCEDLGLGISPKARLLAMASSSLILIALTGYWLPRMGVPYLDSAVKHWAIGIPLTVLVTAAVSNGFNMIDGVNGLSSSSAIIGALALGLISVGAGENDLAYVALIFSAAVLGFWLLNFPFGFIFLGDAGAYAMGFVLSWLGVYALNQIHNLSPWAVLLIFFWPILDTLLAIYRRLITKRDRMAPDRLHVHQLVMRALEFVHFGRHNRQITNPLATAVLLPFVLAPAATGVLFWNNNFGCFIATMAFLFLLFAGYYLTFPALASVRRSRAKQRVIRDQTNGMRGQ